MSITESSRQPPNSGRSNTAKMLGSESGNAIESALLPNIALATSVKSSTQLISNRWSPRYPTSDQRHSCASRARPKRATAELSPIA